MSHMFDVILKNILESFTKKGLSYKLSQGFYRLEDFHEASANRPQIPLGRSIIVVKRISCLGVFAPSFFTSASTFFTLESEGKSIDLSHTASFQQLDNNNMQLISDYPSVHDTFLKVNYDLTTFFSTTGISKASLEYIKIDPV